MNCACCDDYDIWHNLNLIADNEIVFIAFGKLGHVNDVHSAMIIISIRWLYASVSVCVCNIVKGIGGKRFCIQNDNV